MISTKNTKQTNYHQIINHHQYIRRILYQQVASHPNTSGHIHLVSLQNSSTILTTSCVRWAVTYQMDEEESDPHAHVIAFEKALWANGESEDT